MSPDEHYLKKELYDLMKRDSSIFEFLENGSLDGIWYWDIEKVENEWMSPQFWKTLGYDPNEKKHLASEWQDLIHPDDLQMAIENFNKHCLNPNHPYDQVVRYRHKNGSTVWIRCRGIAIRDENGKPIRMLGAHNELTQQKKAAEDIIKEKDYAQKILNTIEAIIVVLDRDGRVSMINPEGCRLLGFSEQEIKGQHWFSKFLPQPDGIENVYPIFLKLIAGEIEAAEYFENSIITKTKKIRQIAWHNSLMHDEDGKVSGTLSFGVDITERKIAEESLRESEARHRTVLETINEGVILQAASGEILTWNKGAENIFGISSEESIGRTSESMAWPTIHEDGTKYEGKHYPSLRTLRTGTPLKNEIMGIYQPSGDLRWISINTNPLFSENDDKPYAVVISFSDITKIKEMEHFYRMMAEMLDEAPNSITIHDFDGNFLYANRKTLEIHGYSYDEFMNLNLRDVDVPESRELIELRMKEVLDKGETSFEVSHFRKDGSIFPMEIFVKSVDWKSKPAMMSIATDITERKQTQESLSKSEELFRNLVNGAPEGIFVQAKERFLFLNPAMAEIFGAINAEDIIGTDLMTRMAPEYHEAIRDRIRLQVETGKPSLPMDQVYLRLDGSRVPVETTAVPTRFRDQDAHLVFVRDITERVKAEETLKESEEKFRMLFENSTDAHVLYSNNRFVDCNHACLEMLGLVDREKFLSLHPSDISPPCQRDGKPSKEKAESMIALAFKKGSHRFEWLCQRSDGSELILDVLLNIIKIQGEDIIHGVWRDITQFEKIQKKIQQSQKVESIGTLAGGIAHDFNNLLFPIIGMSEMLIEDLPSGSLEQENANEILKAGIRGSELVKQILAFSRQAEHKLIPTRVQHILKEVLKLSRSTIPTNIQINQAIQSECGLVMADPTQIHQIAMNIITNAYHAIENVSEGVINVQLKERELTENESAEIDIQPGRYAVLSISDNGRGMPPDIIDKIFDPYFTTKEQGKGTGLGLAVVYGIVKELKGNIKVHSELGKGATFNVYLPLMDKPDRAELIKRVEDYLGGNERILLVDDEKPIAQLEKQMLERLSYKVTMRFSSLEALEVFKMNPELFDLVISDMSMPAMTGDRLARELIAIRPDIPIIICTGFSEKINKEKAVSIGVKGFLMKPIVKAELAKTVRKVLDGA